MKTIDTWLSAYAESHRHPVNQVIHRVCVPLIFWSLIGILSLIRTASGSVWTSAVLVAAVPALLFYFQMGGRVFLEMLGMILLGLGICSLVEMQFAYPWQIYGIVFFLAWVGQALGHVIEGKRPSFFQDLQFLMIGPIWILRKHSSR